MGKSKPAPSRRQYILDADDEARLQKLRTLYDGNSETKVTLSDAVRIALRDACRFRGLEQKPAEPMDPDVRP